jgi:murein endopeptidase
VEVLTQKTQSEGVELKVGNLSAQRGGLLKFSDGKGAHTAHQNGLEVDLAMPYRTDVSSSSRFRTLSSSVDYSALWKVIKALGAMEYQINGQKKPIVNRVYLDRRHIRNLCPLVKTETERQALRLLQHIEGHTTHLHIRLEVTPHNPSAKEVIVRPAEQVCPT